MKGGKEKDLWIDTTWMEEEPACTACLSVGNVVFAFRVRLKRVKEPSALLRNKPYAG